MANVAKSGPTWSFTTAPAIATTSGPILGRASDLADGSLHGNRLAPAHGSAVDGVIAGRGWADSRGNGNGRHGPPISVPTGGPHTLRIQQREDAVLID
jgi:hypothetical protein